PSKPPPPCCTKRCCQSSGRRTSMSCCVPACVPFTLQYAGSVAVAATFTAAVTCTFSMVLPASDPQEITGVTSAVRESSSCSCSSPEDQPLKDDSAPHKNAISANLSG